MKENFELKKSYQREFGDLLLFDPEAEEHEEHEVNQRAMREVVKRYLIEVGLMESLHLKSGESTPYQALKAHPMVNLLCFMSNKLSYDDLYKITVPAKDRNPIFGEEKNPLFTNDLTDLIEVKMLDSVRELREMAKKVILKTSAGEIKELEGLSLDSVDDVLKAAGNPSFNDIVGVVEKAGREVLAQKATLKEITKELRDALDIKKAQEETIRGLNTKVLLTNSTPIEVKPAHEGVPEGKVVTRKASELFPSVKFDVDMDVPSFEWEFPHPDVPKVNENYVFRPVELKRVLYAIVTNTRMMLHGHTGSGKTTLVEQVAAHLNWPFGRINFDSEITRMDLIGRDTLKTDEDGNTVSSFVDGVLPRLMSGPYLACFDEVDFCRPDVAYVMQAALEGNSLRITEDGDRLVKPDPMFRMFGTGNTVGQGDEQGMYQGARAQSMAFLDRFTVWAKVDYLSEKDRKELVKREIPGLGEKDLKALLKYTTEHLDAFQNEGKIILPFTPRGMLAVAKATVIMGSLKEALNMVVLDRCNQDDRSVIKGIIDRVAA